MDARFVVTMAALVLLACGPHRGASDVKAADQPGAVSSAAAAAERTPRSSPVISAVPADDPEPRVIGAAAVQQPVTPPLAIPAGTRIRVRLAQTLDTRYSRAGGTFAATLDDPIVEGDRVVVPRGTPFTGVVVQAKRSGRFRGRALLQVKLSSFQLKGTTYHIATAPDTRVSGSHRKRNLALLGGGPAAGAGIGALAGGGKGALIGAGIGAAAGTTTAFFTGRKHVTLPVETTMVFALRARVAAPRT